MRSGDAWLSTGSRSCREDWPAPGSGQAAAADYYSLNGYRLSAQHRWRFRNGMFLLSRLAWLRTPRVIRLNYNSVLDDPD